MHAPAQNAKDAKDAKFQTVLTWYRVDSGERPDVEVLVLFLFEDGQIEPGHFDDGLEQPWWSSRPYAPLAWAEAVLGDENGLQDVILQPHTPRPETSHMGLPCGLGRMPKMVSACEDRDSGASYWHKLEMRSEMRIERAHKGMVSDACADLGVTDGDASIVILAAPLATLKTGLFDEYETVLFPGHDKWSWKVCWSVARRLALATPARPAIITDSEWGSFNAVELSPYHERCVIDHRPGPLPSQELKDLQQELADELAIQDVESLCLTHQENGATWWEAVGANNEAEEAMQRKAIRYLELRGLLRRMPGYSVAVQIVRDGEIVSPNQNGGGL